MTSCADYASPNFLWFKARFERFVYIDRVVVSVDGRGLGLASRLYADLVEAARSAGHTRIVAEVNSDPRTRRQMHFTRCAGSPRLGAPISGIAAKRCATCASLFEPRVRLLVARHAFNVSR